MEKNKRRNTLSKEERLSWKRYIDLLFQQGKSFVAFPLRIVYLPIEENINSPVSILVSIPKKKIKKAVKRNLLKRQIRETYRTRKHDLVERMTEKNKSILLAFLYIDDKINSFENMEQAMNKAMRLLRDKE